MLSGLLRNVYDRARGRYVYKVGMAVLLVTVVLVGVGYVTFTEVQASVEDDAEGTLLNAAEREAAGIEEFIDSRTDDAIRISGDDVVLNGSEGDIRDRLNDEHARLPDSIVSIHYFNTETETIEVSTDPDREGEHVDEAERPWAVEHIGASPSDARLFEPYEVNGAKHIGFVSLVGGDETHSIVLTVDLEHRSGLLASPVEGGAIQVVSHSEGTVVLAENLDNILGEHFLLDELPFLDANVDEPRIDQVTAETELIDDDELLVATVPVENEWWSVTVVAPQGAVFETVEDVTQSLLLLIGIAVVGLVVVGAVITRDVNKSLTRMTEYAEEIEDGNLDVEIAQSRVDEFGKLTALFIRIRETLNEQLTEVEEQATAAEQAREEALEARENAQKAKAEAEQLSTHLEEKAEEYLVSIEAATAGDLTRRLETESESQDMRDIGNALTSSRA